MRICGNKMPGASPDPIPGHVYRQGHGLFEGHHYIATDDNRLVDLSSGEQWCGEDGFGGEPGRFTDVTDKVCLKVSE